MSRFYFIPSLYLPNTAATNRWLAYLRHLSERNVETHVVFFMPNKEFSKMDDMPNIYAHYYWEHFYLKKGGLKYLSRILYYMHFWFRLKKGDVVYCYEQVNVWKLFLKKGVNVYSEYTEHPEVIGLGGHFFHTSLKSFREKCRKLSGMFVISTALKRYFQELGMVPDKVHIINMIVDSNRFCNLKKQPAARPYIAYCGTVSNNKDGVDELIKAFALFSPRHPEVDLYIIGEAPTEGEFSDNLRLMGELGIRDKVKLTGIVPASKMPQLLKNASILALDRPDNIQAQYGFPTKLGEYLLTENPVVVTKVGDMLLFLRDSYSAFIAESSNAELFASKLEEAYTNKELAAVVGKQGATVARRHFSYATETEKMIEVMGLMWCITDFI